MIWGRGESGGVGWGWGGEGVVGGRGVRRRWEWVVDGWGGWGRELEVHFFFTEKGEQRGTVGTYAVYEVWR